MFKKQLLSLLVLITPLSAEGLPDLLEPYSIEIPALFNAEQKQGFLDLSAALAESIQPKKDKPLSSRTEYLYTIKQIDSDEVVTLNNDSKWKIEWLAEKPTSWKIGHRIRLFFAQPGTRHFLLENLDTQEKVKGFAKVGPSVRNCDKIKKIKRPASLKPSQEAVAVLNSGYSFQGPLGSSQEGDLALIVRQEEENHYYLWNFTRQKLLHPFTLTPGKEADIGVTAETVRSLEETLNKKVLGQVAASKALKVTLTNYLAGFHDAKAPIGVFLFVGPTGVGKTEITKALATELYKSQSHLIRFDMSHFSDQWSLGRLIGSGPGYKDSDKGGQLSNALLETPNSIVLLDEFEKAHDSIRKFFLPVFDEGSFKEAFNHEVACEKTIFIMTSNACSLEISELFNQGYSEEEILEMIEPKLIKAFSPELYNRVTTVLFRPLTPALMEGVVRKMLGEISERAKTERNLTITFDESVIQYLAVKGYHPTLGARPLKRLIQSKVIAFIAQEIIQNDIPDDSFIHLFYDKNADKFLAEWNLE